MFAEYYTFLKRSCFKELRIVGTLYLSLQWGRLIKFVTADTRLHLQITVLEIRNLVQLLTQIWGKNDLTMTLVSSYPTNLLNFSKFLVCN